MTLRANLKDFDLTQVLKFIASSKKSGTLRINRENAEGLIHFRDGEPYYASSSVQRRTLGERLVERGKVAPAQLQRALEIQRSEQYRRRLGAILVDEEILNSEVLQEFVREQVYDSLFDLYDWMEGDFSFALDEVGQEDIGISFEEWERIKNEVSSMETIYRPAQLPEGEDKGVFLQPAEWNLVCRIDGRRSVADLVEETGDTAFHVYRLLHGLLCNGLIAQVGEADEQRLEPAVPSSAVADPGIVDELGDLTASAPAELFPKMPTAPEEPTDPAPEELASSILIDGLPVAPAASEEHLPEPEVEGGGDFAPLASDFEQSNTRDNVSYLSDRHSSQEAEPAEATEAAGEDADASQSDIVAAERMGQPAVSRPSEIDPDDLAEDLAAYWQTKDSAQEPEADPGRLFPGEQRQDPPVMPETGFGPPPAAAQDPSPADAHGAAAAGPSWPATDALEADSAAQAPDQAGGGRAEPTYGGSEAQGGSVPGQQGGAERAWPEAYRAKEWPGDTLAHDAHSTKPPARQEEEAPSIPAAEVSQPADAQMTPESAREEEPPVKEDEAPFVAASPDSGREQADHVSAGGAGRSVGRVTVKSLGPMEILTNEGTKEVEWFMFTTEGKKGSIYLYPDGRCVSDIALSHPEQEALVEQIRKLA